MEIQKYKEEKKLNILYIPTWDKTWWVKGFEETSIVPAFI